MPRILEDKPYIMYQADVSAVAGRDGAIVAQVIYSTQLSPKLGKSIPDFPCDSYAYYSLSTLAGVCGISIQQVRAALTILTDLGVLDTQSRGIKTPCFYSIDAQILGALCCQQQKG